MHVSSAPPWSTPRAFGAARPARPGSSRNWPRHSRRPRRAHRHPALNPPPPRQTRDRRGRRRAPARPAVQHGARAARAATSPALTPGSPAASRDALMARQSACRTASAASRSRRGPRWLEPCRRRAVRARGSPASGEGCQTRAASARTGAATGASTRVRGGAASPAASRGQWDVRDRRRRSSIRWSNSYVQDATRSADELWSSFWEGSRDMRLRSAYGR